METTQQTADVAVGNACAGLGETERAASKTSQTIHVQAGSFGTVPDDLLFDAELTDRDVRIYLAQASFAWGGKCISFAGQGSVGRLLGIVHRQSVSRSLRRLRKRGWVGIRRRGPRTRRREYLLLPHPNPDLIAAWERRDVAVAVTWPSKRPANVNGSVDNFRGECQRQGSKKHTRTLKHTRGEGEPNAGKQPNATRPTPPPVPSSPKQSERSEPPKAAKPATPPPPPPSEPEGSGGGGRPEPINARQIAAAFNYHRQDAPVYGTPPGWAVNDIRESGASRREIASAGKVYSREPDALNWTAVARRWSALMARVRGRAKTLPPVPGTGVTPIPEDVRKNPMDPEKARRGGYTAEFRAMLRKQQPESRS